MDSVLEHKVILADESGKRMEVLLTEEEATDMKKLPESERVAFLHQLVDKTPSKLRDAKQTAGKDHTARKPDSQEVLDPPSAGVSSETKIEGDQQKGAINLDSLDFDELPSSSHDGYQASLAKAYQAESESLAPSLLASVEQANLLEPAAPVVDMHVGMSERVRPRFGIMLVDAVFTQKLDLKEGAIDALKSLQSTCDSYSWGYKKSAKLVGTWESPRVRGRKDLEHCPLLQGVWIAELDELRCRRWFLWLPCGQWQGPQICCWTVLQFEKPQQIKWCLDFEGEWIICRQLDSLPTMDPREEIGAHHSRHWRRFMASWWRLCQGDQRMDRGEIACSVGERSHPHWECRRSYHQSVQGDSSQNKLSHQCSSQTMVSRWHGWMAKEEASMFQRRVQLAWASWNWLRQDFDIACFHQGLGLSSTVWSNVQRTDLEWKMPENPLSCV